MKNNKVLIIICVILLNVLVVFMIGQAFQGRESDYDKQLRLAREHVEKNLLRKAIGYYDAALILEESLDVRLEMLQVHEKAVENGEFKNVNAISQVIEELVEQYPQEVRAYEYVTGFLEKYGRYEDCAEVLVQADERKVTSEALDALRERVRYMYKVTYTMYSDISSEYGGTYLAKIDDKYMLLNSGLGAIAGSYRYASVFSSGYAFVRQGDENEPYSTYLINQAGIRQCYFDGVSESSGVSKVQLSEEQSAYLMACKVNGRYQYYDLTGKPVFGDYLFAGRFRNNIAAVQKGENEWYLINPQGNLLVDTVFEDIILNEFDECAPMGRIFAKTNGKYHIYDMTGKQVGDFACDDARPFIETVTAFKTGDLWGYVDAYGTVVFEPQYDDAKAFSKGVAGVKQNGVWSFMDSTGKTVIQGDFEEAGHMGSNGCCLVKTNGRWTVLKMYYTSR